MVPKPTKMMVRIDFPRGTVDIARYSTRTSNPIFGWMWQWTS